MAALESSVDETEDTHVELTSFNSPVDAEEKQQKSDSIHVNGAETRKEETGFGESEGTVKVVDVLEEIVLYQTNVQEEALDESPLLQVQSGSSACHHSSS